MLFSVWTEDELFAAYWRYQELFHSSERSDRLGADEFYWAWEHINDAAMQGSEGVVPLLVRLSDSAPDEASLCAVGAGPLETLVQLNGPTFEAEIADEVRRNPRFRAAAWDCVWR